MPPPTALLPEVAAPAPVVKHRKPSQEALLPEDGSDDVIVVNRSGETGTPSAGVSGTSATTSGFKTHGDNGKRTGGACSDWQGKLILLPFACPIILSSHLLRFECLAEPSAAS